MHPKIDVVEVIGRSVQGMTRPFHCRGDDDNLYYVKGRGAGRRSLLCEWYVGHLATGFGLNIAPYTVAEVSQDLVNLVVEGGDLGAGPAFASKSVAPLQELSWAHVEEIPIEIQCGVLVFDFWIRNMDRQLTKNGGNPNLFWNPEKGELVVIDHNQAFDNSFSKESFLDFHVFRSSLPYISADFSARFELERRCESALQAWDDAKVNAPAEWSYEDREHTIFPDIDLDAIRVQLGISSSSLIEDIWQ